MRILVVDDEEHILKILRPTLEAAGYEVQTVQDGLSAKQALTEGQVDAMILDLGLPDMDGKEIISFATQKSTLPIIVLSARGTESEKIEALDRGAHDYVAKPFTVGELLARIRAALRPPRKKKDDLFEAGGIRIDFANRRMTVGQANFRLSGREAELLRVLAGSPDTVLSHREIIAAVWPNKTDVETQYVRVLVNQLRQKLELEPAAANLLVTESGLGYRINLPRAS